MRSFRFSLRFPHTFYILAMLVAFLGALGLTVMAEDSFNTSVWTEPSDPI